MLVLLHHPLHYHIVFSISIPDRYRGDVILIVKYHEGVTIMFFCKIIVSLHCSSGECFCGKRDGSCLLIY